MTREEAISLLRNIKTICDFYSDCGEECPFYIKWCIFGDMPMDWTLPTEEGDSE